MASAAIITPQGEGGIGIIVLAGAGAEGVLDAVFRGSRRSAGELAPGRIAHGRIVRGGAVVDEVIVARVPCGDEGPVFEINCHGGVQAVRAVLRCLVEAGARQAGAGALPGPREDPARPLGAESVRSAALALLPRAQTRLGARMLLAQAAGALSAEVASLGDELGAAPERARQRLARLLDTAPLALALLEPPKVLLTGPPNVGKSTLMNALLRRERVIVHHRPGTTRDVVRELVSLRGVPMELMDSAGLREARGEIERRAVGKAAGLIADCDVALALFDARRGPGWALERLEELRAAGRLILVGNKIDLLRRGQRAPELPPELGGVQATFISAREGRGIELVEEALLAPYAGVTVSIEQGGAAAFTPRIAAALERVAAALEEGGADLAGMELQGLS